MTYFMTASRDEIQRLAFTKYLLSLAARHFNEPEPLASVGLLLLHDATEHLLNLICHHVGADPTKSDFLGYWRLIDEKRPGKAPLPDKGRMSAFNSARVQLKHKGIQPAKSQLMEFQNLVLAFFEQVVPDVFGLPIAAVNLTAFVMNDKARAHLEASTLAIENARFSEAVTEAAYAYDELLSHALGSENRLLGRHLAAVPGSAPYIYQDGYSTNTKAHEFFQGVIQAIDALNDAVAVLALGFDFAKHARFQALAPEVVTYIRGQKNHFDRRKEKTPHTRSEAEFCINFVVDCAFRTQENQKP